MIYECPKCSTTHSKSEREIGAGVEVKCRRCAFAFWVTTQGVSELPAGGSATASPIEAFTGSPNPTVPSFNPPRPRPEVSEFHQARTELMAVPQGVTQPSVVAPPEAGFGQSADEMTIQAPAEVIRAGLAAMQSEATVPELEVPDSAAATAPDHRLPAAPISPPALASASAGAQAKAALEDFDDIDSMDGASTRVSTNSEISDMLRRITGEQPDPATVTADPFADRDSASDSTSGAFSAPPAPPAPQAAASIPTPVAVPDSALSVTGDGRTVPRSLGDLENSVSIVADRRDDGFGTEIAAEERPGRRPSPVRQPSSRHSPAFGSRKSGGLPRFPLPELKVWGEGWWRYLRAQPLVVQVMTGVVAALGLLVIVLLGAVVFGEESRLAFVEADADLMSGPGKEEPYARVASLSRGEEILLFPSGNWGEWVMVRDLMGRAGFVERQVVTMHQPTASVGTPFAGCRRSPLEEDISLCRTRGQVQLNLCREACEVLDEEGTCVDQCQRQFEDCLRGCEGKAVGAVVKPQPVVDDPGSDADPAVDDAGARKPVKKPPPPPPRKKKKKR